MPNKSLTECIKGKNNYSEFIGLKLVVICANNNCYFHTLFGTSLYCISTAGFLNTQAKT
jgi:hypothetical protein